MIRTIRKQRKSEKLRRKEGRIGLSFEGRKEAKEIRRTQKEKPQLGRTGHQFGENRKEEKENRRNQKKTSEAG